MVVLLIYQSWSKEIRDLLDAIKALLEDYSKLEVNIIHAGAVIDANLPKYEALIIGPILFGKWSQELKRIANLNFKIPIVLYYALVGKLSKEERMIELYNGIEKDKQILNKLKPISVALFEKIGSNVKKGEFSSFYFEKELTDDLPGTQIEFQNWESYAEWVTTLGEEIQFYTK